jgi:L-histidine N-alpha-methyltransferase
MTAGAQVVDLSAPTLAIDDGQDLLRGLRNTPKEIPTKYGYDCVGSELFEEITRLPAYYLPRLERQLLAGCAAELARIAPWRELVELGSGSSRKTRLLLDEMSGPRVIYTPIDISGPMLAAATAELAGDYPALSVRGVIGTFEAGLSWVAERRAGPRLTIMLGSTFGNMTDEERATLLAAARVASATGDYLLLAADLAKSAPIIEHAYRAGYDTPGGVRRRFALNRLEHLNALFGADFDTGRFEPQSAYHADRRCVEAQLRSTCEQTVSFSKLGTELEIAREEVIVRDVMHKFTTRELDTALNSHGFARANEWLDDRSWYGLFLYRC